MKRLCSDDDFEQWAALCYSRVDGFPEGTVYFAIARDIECRVKIGWTAGAISHRLAKLQTGCPTELSASFVFRGGKALEGEMHARFSRHRSAGEWFDVEGDLARFVVLCDQRLREAS